MRPVFLLLLVLLTPSPSRGAPEPLNPHAFRKLVDKTRGAVLQVVSNPPGSAVLVGVGGELLAPEHLVRKDTLLVELPSGRKVATLRERDTKLGVALLTLEPGEYPAATVGSADSLARGEPLLALWYAAKGGLQTSVGRFDRRLEDKRGERLRSDVGGPVGSALFNAKGQLVALNLGRKLAMVPIEVVKARFLRKAEE